MRRTPARLAFMITLVVLAALASPAVRPARGASTPKCADTLTEEVAAAGRTKIPSPPTGSAPEPGRPCWLDEPYPFRNEGGPDPVSECFNAEEDGGFRCYLTVTSMAFRAWNRGLAATANTLGKDAYVVWTFNGTSWSPAATPPPAVCAGHVIIWAGKRDYWLIGGSWGDLCRFNGLLFQWEPLEVPQTTKERVTEQTANGPALKLGGIATGTCFAWNECWFFGSYGVVLYWNGETLSDASPSLAEHLVQGEYTSAVSGLDLAGNPFGVAVAATSESRHTPAEPLQPNAGEPPAQLYSSTGGAFSPESLTPPTTPEPNDPYRTDLVSVGVDVEGQGWAAGNPAMLQLVAHSGRIEEQNRPASRNLKTELPPEQFSPLVPFSTSGSAIACKGPPSSAFPYTYEKPGKTEGLAEAFLWSSIAVLPAGEALSGGRMWPSSAQTIDVEDAQQGEPVVVRAGCHEEATVTRFRSLNTLGEEGPTDLRGGVSAIAANAPNDAWVATTPGEFLTGLEKHEEAPRLYRLSNGEPPEAPEGNELETRPPPAGEDQPTIIQEPPGPEPPPLPAPPATVTEPPVPALPPAYYDVNVKLHEIKRRGRLILDLYLTFKVRSPVTLGAEALRHGHVVSKTRPRRFTGKTGVLVLTLNRKRWPTKVSLIS